MRKLSLAIIVVVAVLAVILSGCKSEAGKKSPPFTLKSFDGKEISLSDYKGKIVVLEWFNDECPFVKYHYDTVTTMVGLANKYKDKGVIWLAINSTNHTTPEQNKEFAAKHNLPYPILDDRSGKVGRAYNATNTPHMFVMDQKGNIVYAGAIDNGPMGKPPAGKDLINHVDKALGELISGKPVSVTKTDAYGCNVKYARPAPSGS
jgi:peroxiredoxin